MAFIKDVHEYDGKISHCIFKRFNKSEKEKAFSKLLELSPLKEDFQAVTALKLIIDNLETSSNYDHSNNFYADDILMEITQLLVGNTSETILCLLAEQMKDMATLGPCAQGRCGRLLQIYKAFAVADIILDLQFISNTDQICYKVIFL
jgi:hypothetical protein